jgi:hypothetical protein
MSRDHVLHKVRTALGRSAGQPVEEPPPVRLDAIVTDSKDRPIRDLKLTDFEVTDSGWEAAIGSHVGVAEQTETQLEIERFGESLLLKDPGANDLAGDGCQDFILARGQNVDSRNLRLLMKLLGAEFDRLARAVVLRLLQRGLEEHLPQQIRVVEILRVAFEEGDSGEFRLLRVQILRLRELKQWTDVIGLRRVNDDDALALLDDQGVTQGEELRILLHVGDQVEHLSRTEGHAAGGAERGHSPLPRACVRRQRCAASRAAFNRAKSSPA